MKKIIRNIVAGIILVSSAGFANAVEIPVTDQGLFAHLFKEYSIPKDWINEAARDELHPSMIAEATTRLLINGGKFIGATKKGSNWVLEFEKGFAPARIMRSQNHKLVGVFFGKVK